MDDDAARSDVSWGEQQRELAALLAGLADLQEAAASDLRSLDNALTRAIAADADMPGLAELAAMGEAEAYRLRTVQRLVAEQARNYDAYLTAGGNDNPAAQATWRDACERTAALMPTSCGSALGT